jgi:hypothetical protein
MIHSGRSNGFLGDLHDGRPVPCLIITRQLAEYAVLEAGATSPYRPRPMAHTQRSHGAWTAAVLGGAILLMALAGLGQTATPGLWTFLVIHVKRLISLVM